MSFVTSAPFDINLPQSGKRQLQLPGPLVHMQAGTLHSDSKRK